MSEPPFRFISLGRVDLRHESRGPVATLLAQPKRLALLAYLLVAHPGGHAPRESLLAMFWPDSDESRARAALRQALQFLRRTLGDEAVVVRGEDAVGIAPSVVAHDLSGLRAAIASDRAEDAVAAYAGELLPGLVVDESPAFEQWLANEREALRQRVVQLALTASHSAVNNVAARDLATRAVELAPDDEVASRRLATLHAAAGNRAAALRELDRLRVVLRDSLGVEPSVETVTLEHSLRHASATQPAPETDDAVLPDQPSAGRTESHATMSAETATLQPHQGRALRWAFAGAAVVLTLFVLRQPLRKEARPALTDPVAAGALLATAAPRVAVAPFDDHTGDARFAAVGSMVADWVIAGVSGMDGVTVVPLTAIRASSRALQSDDSPRSGMTQDLQHRVALDVGATVLVRGVVYLTDSTLHLQAQLTRMPTGELLQAAETVSVPADQIMQGLEQLRRRVVASLAPLGDSVSHLRHAAAPPSYEAYRDYVRGLEQFVQGNTDDALRLFRSASGVDTSYAMPRIAASIALLNLGRADDAAEQIAGLDAQRADLPPLERATFDMLRGMLDGNLVAVDRAVREQARIAPGTIGEYMVAETARRRGQPAQALRVLRALGPDRGELRGWRPYWRELTGALHMLGDYEGEYRAAEDAMARYGREPVMLGYAVRALAARGDSAGVVALIRERDLEPGHSAPDAGALWHIAANQMDAGCARRAKPEVDCRSRKNALSWWREQELRWLSSRSTVSATAPRGNSLRWRHARALALSGRWAAARDTLVRVTPQRDEQVEYHGLRGAIAAALGDSLSETRALSQLTIIQQGRSAAARSLAEGDVDYWMAVMAAQHQNSPAHADAALAALQRAMSGWRGRDITLASDPWFAGLRTKPLWKERFANMR